MSSKKYEKRRPSSPSNTRGNREVSARKVRGRYDVWSRTESDTLRKEVARLLCEGSIDCVSDRTDPFTFFSALPDCDWSDADLAKTLRLNQVRALFSKDEDMRSPIDREKVAFDAFRQSEASCEAVNDAFRDGTIIRNDDAFMILSHARWKICQILGKAPLIRDLQPSFGPGANVTCRKKTSARFKLSTPPSISRPSLNVLFQMVEGVKRWYQLHGTVKVVPGSLEFVAKNYKTDRAIVIGPSLTGMYQRSVGAYMKQRLLQSGIDLKDGQAHQRERARAASLTGSDATIDLSAASDSIAYMLVLELLPDDWFELLDNLRDDRVLYRGTVYPLEKFSSMGNGYTFELESTIFYSLIYGISKHFGIPFHRETCSIYGDDIIVPVGPLTSYIFEWFPTFGFKINREKSFFTGSFRESCGGDYCSGVDVRPYFIKQRMNVHILVCFYNHFMRKPHQDPDRKIRNFLLSKVPEKYRNFGPDGFGDGHLISGSPFNSYAEPMKRDFGWSGFTFNTFVEIPTRDKTPQKGDCLLPSYSIALNRSFLEDVNPRYSGLRGHFLASFVRAALVDAGSPLDHFVLRRERGTRVRGRKIRIYVLGADL